MIYLIKILVLIKLIIMLPYYAFRLSILNYKFKKAVFGLKKSVAEDFKKIKDDPQLFFINFLSERYPITKQNAKFLLDYFPPGHAIAIANKITEDGVPFFQAKERLDKLIQEQNLKKRS